MRSTTQRWHSVGPALTGQAGKKATLYMRAHTHTHTHTYIYIYIYLLVCINICIYNNLQSPMHAMDSQKNWGITYYYYYRCCLLSQAFFLELLLNQRWPPPLRLQVSHCSTFRIMCDVPSIAVFCSESIECFPGIASRFIIIIIIIIPNHGTRWRLTVSVKNPPLHPREKDPMIIIEQETRRNSAARLNASE
jgi:hypothetical protein